MQNSNTSGVEEMGRGTKDTIWIDNYIAQPIEDIFVQKFGGKNVSIPDNLEDLGRLVYGI